MDKGCRVMLYALPGEGGVLNPFLWNDACNGVPIQYVRFTVSFRPLVKILYPLNIISHKKALRTLQAHKPDLIHERFHTPNPYGVKLANEMGIKRVLEVNSLYIEDGAYTGRKAEIARHDRAVQFEHASAIITQTETLKKMIGGLTDRPIFVVPNGVDTAKFTPEIDSNELKSRLGIKDEIVITFLGSFRKWHGVHQIPEIAKRFGSDVKFLLIGSGELFEEIKGLKTDNMILLGSIANHDEIPKYLALSDILIAPFDHEYFKTHGFWWNPVKLFEYASSGKPVVSYDFEEVRKIVSGGGLLAEPGNIDDFVGKLKYLVDNESEREKIGKEGRRIALEGYDWSERAKEVIDVYKHVL